jgi:hypothetical protein
VRAEQEFSFTLHKGNYLICWDELHVEMNEHISGVAAIKCSPYYKVGQFD